MSESVAGYIKEKKIGKVFPNIQFFKSCFFFFFHALGRSLFILFLEIILISLRCFSLSQLQNCHLAYEKTP